MISLLPTEQFINFFSKMNILFLKKENTFISFAVSNSSPKFFHLLSFLAVIFFPSLASSLPDAVFPSFFFSFPLINHFHHFPLCSFSLFPFFSAILFLFFYFWCCSDMLFHFAVCLHSTLLSTVTSCYSLFSPMFFLLVFNSPSFMCFTRSSFSFTSPLFLSASHSFLFHVLSLNFFFFFRHFHMIFSPP